jgi:hypothetical protein
MDRHPQIVRFLEDGSISRREWALPNTDDDVLAMKWSPDGAMVALELRNVLSGKDSTWLYTLDSRTGAHLGNGSDNFGQFELTHDSLKSIQCFQWSKENHLAVLSGKDVRIWSPGAPHASPEIIPLSEKFYPPADYHRPVGEMTWSPDGTMLLVWGNWNVLIYDFKRKAIVLHMNGYAKWSTDGKWLSVVTYNPKSESSHFVIIPVSSLLPLASASTAQGTTSSSFPEPLHREIEMQDSQEFFDGFRSYMTIHNLAWIPDGRTIATTYYPIFGSTNPFGVNWWDIGSGKLAGKMRIPSEKKSIKLLGYFPCDFDSSGDLSPNASHLLIANQLTLESATFGGDYYHISAIRILPLVAPPSIK